MNPTVSVSRLSAGSTFLYEPLNFFRKVIISTLIASSLCLRLIASCRNDLKVILRIPIYQTKKKQKNLWITLMNKRIKTTSSSTTITTYFFCKNRRKNLVGSHALLPKVLTLCQYLMLPKISPTLPTLMKSFSINMISIPKSRFT